MKALLFVLLLSTAASAQYFSRNSVQLPSSGWLALGQDTGATGQVQIGSGYARDLYDLKLWWINETALGLGYANYPGAPASRMALTLQGSTGVKYNFFTRRWRPFVGVVAEVLEIFNGINPTFGALRPMVGLEWIYGEDLGIEAQVGYVLLMNFEDPVRHSAMARVAYRVYF